MSKKILIAALAVLLIAPLFLVPYPWFDVEMGMSREYVYALCGEPDSLNLVGVKGEKWLSRGVLWKFTMLVGFDDDKVSHAVIWLDIGGERFSERVFLKYGGKWCVRMFGEKIYCPKSER